MGAKERKQLVKSADALLKQMEDAQAVLVQCQADLAQLAQDIVDDFEEQRDNLADNESFLNRWEDDHGYKSESWETAASDLDEEPEDLAAAAREAWEQGEQ